MSPLQDPLPANAWSIDSGVAALIVEPWTRDLSSAERREICGAKRVRIFIDNRPSRPALEPLKFEHYPIATLRWCVALATSILPGVFDFRKPSRTEDIEALLRKFDIPDDADEFCIIRVLADDASGIDNCRAMYRDYVPFRAKIDEAKATA
jgi:hypothetical protein